MRADEAKIQLEKVESAQKGYSQYMTTSSFTLKFIITINRQSHSLSHRSHYLHSLSTLDYIRPSS